MLISTYISLVVLCLLTTATNNEVSATDAHSPPPENTPTHRPAPVSDHRFWETFGNGFLFKDASALRLSAVDVRYDDTKCATEFNDTVRAVGNMELWAIKSKSSKY